MEYNARYQKKDDLDLKGSVLFSDEEIVFTSNEGLTRTISYSDVEKVNPARPVVIVLTIIFFPFIALFFLLSLLSLFSRHSTATYYHFSRNKIRITTKENGKYVFKILGFGSNRNASKAVKFIRNKIQK